MRLVVAWNVLERRLRSFFKVHVEKMIRRFVTALASQVDDSPEVRIHGCSLMKSRSTAKNGLISGGMPSTARAVISRWTSMPQAPVFTGKIRRTLTQTHQMMRAATRSETTIGPLASPNGVNPEDE